MKLLVGLGNPGRAYVGTRHNIGFDVVDRVARLARVDWGPPRFESEWAQGAVAGRPVALVKPQTYMNASGRAIRAAVAFYKVSPRAVLIVCDEFQLPLGTVRFRARGTSGGHNGLASAIEALATQDVPRLRCGVGPLPAGQDPRDFVLSRFAPEERPVAETMAEAAAERACAWLAAPGEDEEASA